MRVNGRNSAATDRSGVGVLHKTLDVLELLRNGQDGARLSDLARGLDLPKATVYRILMTLEARGYVDRDDGGGYRMARKFFDLRRDEPIDQLLQRAAQMEMARLVEITKETVNLGILDAGEIVVIHTVESPQAVRMSSKVGNRRHLHATALGKVMLAGMTDAELLRMVRLKGLPKVTPNTIATKTALIEEIHRVREQGFAIDNQENEMEGRCIGAPIQGPSGNVIAALSVSGPVFRMPVSRAHATVGTLVESCAAISSALRR
jgi:IclR family transcriptional regulator, KDG regulon repressor